MKQQSLQLRLLAFGIITTLVVLSCAYIVNSNLLNSHAALDWAVTLDLTLTIPIVYFLFIRNTNISRITLIPVFLLSLFVASVVIPPGHQEYLDIVKYLIIPIEIFVACFLIYRARQITVAMHAARETHSDFVETLNMVLNKYVQQDILRNALITEISTFYYITFGWKSKIEAPDVNAFSYHKRCAYFTVLGVLTFVIILEGVAGHLLIAQWLPVVAWVVTGLTIYGMIFLFADANAIRRRPIFIENDFLHFRVGLRWRAKLALADIESVIEIKRKPDEANHLSATLIGSPNILIRFKSEQTAVGLYGIKKRFDSVSISIDRPEQFLLSIQEQP